MSSAILSLRDIKATRKDHCCGGCGQTIPAGSPAHYGFGDLYESGRMISSYLCRTCSPGPMNVRIVRKPKPSE